VVLTPLLLTFIAASKNISRKTIGCNKESVVVLTLPAKRSKTTTAKTDVAQT
jgi:hypothetical protein